MGGNMSTSLVVTKPKDDGEEPLLYLVQIDPEGQRVGSHVRVVSKYPVHVISKITSKKNSPVPTRCFYFKQKEGSGLKPYLGFSVCFDAEEVAKNCTQKIADVC